MKPIRFDLPEDFNLILCGDTHIGTALCYRGGIEAMIDIAQSPLEGLKAHRNYIIHHGDMIEAISRDDPRYQEDLPSKYILEQIDDAENMFKRCKRQLLVLLQGNHERKIWRYGDVTKTLCRRLDCYNGTYSCHITYGNKKRDYFSHFATHGFGQVNSVAGDVIQQIATMKKQVKFKLKNKFGDTLLNSMGHTHKEKIIRPEPEVYMYYKDGKLEQGYTTDHIPQTPIPDNLKWYVNTSSFYRLYADIEDCVDSDPKFGGASGYAEVGGYNPVVLGFSIVIVRGGEIVDIKPVRV